MKKIIIDTVIALLVVSPFVLIAIMPINEVDRQPNAIYEKDGCTVYRYYDKGNRMYFTKCGDKVTEADNK